MTTFKPMPQSPRPANPLRIDRRRRDRQGSAIILVIVAIVLMAVLGATFVQVARFERISAGGEHIDIAIDSILNEVAVELAEDLYAANGNFFNPGGDDATNGRGDEPYDYPWTNNSIAARRVAFVDGGGIAFAEGGMWDDPWLASTSLKDLSNDGSAAPNPLEWAHVSDLTGRFLNVADRDLVAWGQANPGMNPGEFASTAAFVTDVPLSGADPLAGANRPASLVDADGDGIGDSFWAYAPAAEIAGKRYVYAIRIIDLSARVNVNVATGGTDNAGNNPQGTTRSARGDSPSEIDGMAVGHAYGVASGIGGTTGANSFAITNGYRLNRFVPNWGDGDQERRHYWLNSASRVTPGLVNLTVDASHPNYDPARTYGQGDLFELLYKGGLNNPGVTTTLESNTEGMFNLLRAGSGTEIDFSTSFANAADFMTDNPRLVFTTASGGMVVAPGVSFLVADPTLNGPDTDGDGVAERVLQADLNHSSVNAIATVIAETVNAGGNFDFANHAHVPNASEYGSQLAVNIVDMRDPDNRLTNFNGQFGMEALPFLTEVYVQREYGVPAPGILNADGLTYTISYSAASASDYAIELRNPFPRPIPLAGVHLFVGGATWGELSALPGAPTELQPGGLMVIYSNQATGEDMVAGLTASPTVHLIDLSADVGRQWPGAVGPSADVVQVELRAEAQAAAGTALAWAYSRFESSAPPASYTESTASAQVPLELRPFLEISDQGTGTGLNMLQTRPADVVETTTEPSEARGTGATPALGNANKAFTPTNNWDTGDQQWLFLDKQTSGTDTRGRIPYVADILTIPVVGPNDNGAPGATLAEAIAQSAATRLDGLMLNYRRATAPVIDPSATYDPLNVPHATLLTSRLTTHSPAVDGEDLNGDGNGNIIGTTDPDEVFVPGKINLNTATYDVLRTALPFPSAAMRDAIAQRIIDHRTGASRPVGSRTEPGVAYIGELYESVQLDVDANIGAVGGQGAWDWNNHQTGGVTSGTTFIADGITGDREEDLMLAKWLDEVCSTRSDVFAVYMVVQGYPAGNFGAGAVESARVVAVFSRANVRQVGDKAQLIAVRRVE